MFCPELCRPEQTGRLTRLAFEGSRHGLMGSIGSMSPSEILFPVSTQRRAAFCGIVVGFTPNYLSISISLNQ